MSHLFMSAYKNSGQGFSAYYNIAEVSKHVEMVTITQFLEEVGQVLHVVYYCTV